jgi:DNA mismatch repair protein MLH1
MGKPSKEYKRILDVMTAHAIHYGDRGVSFVCKKNSGSADISTPAKSSITANIRRLLGNDVARDILEIEHETKIQGDTAIEMKLNGRISNPNYNRKKSKFIVFVNDRLVDCRRIRKAIELVYSSYLPRKTHPFAYISLKIPPHIVDVNVCTSLVSISKSQTHTHTHTNHRFIPQNEMYTFFTRTKSSVQSRLV